MQENHNRRRNFLKKAVLGSAALLSIPEIVSAALPTQNRGKLILGENEVILFQGDSITDAGRKREEKNNSTGIALGAGYVFLAASELLYRNQHKNLVIYNRGISAQKAPELAERWDRDCLQLKPTVLSVLVGVNDYWHTIKRDYKGTPESYKRDYTGLLNRTKEGNPDVKFIIGQPFGIPGIKGNYENWGPEFKEYQQAAAEVARSFGAILIPYQKIFDKALSSAPATYWTWDGVHPTPAGSKLMAEAWLSVIKS